MFRLNIDDTDAGEVKASTSTTCCPSIRRRFESKNREITKNEEAGKSSKKEVIPLPTDNENPLSTVSIRLIEATFRIIRRRLHQKNTTVGNAVFKRIFGVSPELQQSFGFNHCAKTPLFAGVRTKKPFTGHGDAFDELITSIVHSLDNDDFNTKLLPLLHTIGSTHWGYVNTGFESKYVWSFVTALNQVVGEQLRLIENMEGTVREEVSDGGKTDLLWMQFSSSKPSTTSPFLQVEPIEWLASNGSPIGSAGNVSGIPSHSPSPPPTTDKPLTNGHLKPSSRSPPMTMPTVDVDKMDVSLPLIQSSWRTLGTLIQAQMCASYRHTMMNVDTARRHSMEDLI